MSTHYNFEVSQDGSYRFTSDHGHNYKVYFFETLVPDREGNGHLFLNFGFSRDDEHACNPFTIKYDSKIEVTIIYILNTLFEKHDHRVLIYFCFGDDGYARHRKITFNKWKRGLSPNIENHDATIKYEEHEVFSCLLVVNNNPLKHLIVAAYDAYVQDLNDDQQQLT